MAVVNELDTSGLEWSTSRQSCRLRPVLLAIAMAVREIEKSVCAAQPTTRLLRSVTCRYDRCSLIQRQGAQQIDESICWQAQGQLGSLVQRYARSAPLRVIADRCFQSSVGGSAAYAIAGHVACAGSRQQHATL